MNTPTENPIFSSYTTIDPKFNENMDEYVKAPNDIYIEQQKAKITQKENKDINKSAFENIPQLPEFMKEDYEQAYKMPEWFDKLNIVTPEEIEEWKRKGPMGVGEAWARNNKWKSFLPYVNTTEDTAESINAVTLLNRYKKGKPLTDAQKELLVDYLRELKELQVRGFSFGGGTVNAILTSIPYLEEFAIGLATSAEGIGLASLGKTLSSIAAKNAARKTAENVLKQATKRTIAENLAHVGLKEGLKATAKAMPSALGTSAKFAITKMPHQFVGNVADRQLATGVYVTDLGDAVFKDSENLALSIMKAFGESTFEALTETSGWAFSPVLNFFAKPVQKLLPKKFFTEFSKLVSSRYGMPAANALRKYGYDGVIEEMGEELLNRFLCQVFGINGLKEYTFDGFMNNVFYANNPTQWAQEALSFAAVSGAGHLVAGTGSKVVDEWKKHQENKVVKEIADKGNQYIQTPEKFYLDQGLIKISGSQSLAEQKLRSIWTHQNIDEDLQDAVLSNMSENDIRKELKNNIQNSENSAILDAQTEQRKEDIEEQVYNKLLKANVRKDVAFANAKLFGQFFKKYGAKNIEAFNKWFDKFNVQYDVPNDAQNNVQNDLTVSNTSENIKPAFDEVIKSIEDNNLPSYDDAYKYSDMGFGYLRSKIEDAREMYDRYNKSIEELDKVYNDKISKAKTQKTKDKLQAEYQEKIKQADTMLENTKNTILNDIKNVLKEVENSKTPVYNQGVDVAGAKKYEIADAKREWKAKGTESKYFKKWFGNSKIVDENGKPLIVYHGTNANFEKFEIGDIGYHFGNYEQANERMTDFVDGEPHIMPAYLKMENPLDIVSDVGDWLDVDTVKEYLHEYEVLSDEELKNINTLSQISSLLQSKGYDGIIYENQFEGKGKSYIVFNSSQIKSVDNRGTFDANNPNIYYQSAISPKTSQKAREVLNALNKIANGSEEETVKNLRNDLDQYGGTNDVTFIFGDNKKGIKHIAEKHGRKTLLKVFDTVIDGKIKRYVESKKTVIIGKGNYEAVLSLDEHGNKKTWLLSGWDITKNNKKSSDVNGEVSAQSDTTQIKPTFSRQDLGAELSTIITDNDKVFNPKSNTYLQSAYHGTPHKFDKFSLDNIGTGEGAQAHGWGLYFAGDKNVSEDYRKTLSDTTGIGTEIKVDNKIYKKVATNTYRNKDDVYEDVDYYFNKALNFIETKGSKKDALKFVEKQIEINKDAGYFDDAVYYVRIKDALNGIKQANITKYADDYGQLFEVDIPDNDVLLDEDKRISEQSQKVQDAIKTLFDNEVKDKVNFEELNENIKILELEIEELENEDPVDYDYNEYLINEKKQELERLKLQRAIKDIYKHHYTGKYIYRTLSDIYGSDKAASEKLNEYGIKGITYDGRQDGRCYVIFDDKAIKVLNTYYQEADDINNAQLIAGYTYEQVLDKANEISDACDNAYNSGDSKLGDELMAKFHILVDAINSTVESSDLNNSDKLQELYLNVYYVMNNQEIPQEYIDADKNSQRSYRDLVEIHNKKKEEAEREYYGYFKETDDENIITIMSNHNSSTALHELGHLFLNGLNEMAAFDENAQKQLQAVNKWLGAVNGEYTVAQHEKFARSFEAYLYKGKAPNNYLRQVFENFKEWLKSVYHHITDIENLGADISDEVQEMFDNIFGSDEFYNERKESTKLLRKVKNTVRKEKYNNIPVRDDKDLDEVEKRHKEISYQILSAATDKSIKYLKSIFETKSDRKSFSKKRENIEFLLDDVGDRISASGGMLQEWKEFYYVPDDEIGFDYELASQALDTIINKDYRNPENILNDRYSQEAEYYEKIINDANKQYALLLKSFKSDNRNIALAAIYEWLDGLDNSIKQEYEDKFIYDAGIIERDEKVYKFDKVKRDIISKALELENQYSINSNEKYIETVKEIMKKLNFLQPSDKAKLTSNILDIPSTSLLMARLDEILDIAQTMEDVQYRRNLEREIHKELQTTKNIKKNGRTVGKYDYKTNKIFEELRALDRLSAEQANEHRLELSKFVSAEDNGLSYQEKLYNKFLSYKAGGRTFADTNLMKELYDEIIKIKLIGKYAKSEIDLQEYLSEEKDVDELIDIVQKKKDANIFLKGYVNGIANLESTMNALFNKSIKEKYASEILYAETQAQAWQYEQKQNFEKEVAKIYNLPQWCWDKKILEYLGEKHTYSEFRRKYDKETGDVIKVRNIDRTLTKMDIIGAYIWSKNKVLNERLKNQFGEEQLDAMFDEMSIQDVKFAELMMRTAQSFYPLVNKAFIEKYGLDLPRVSCYFPSTPERGSEVDLYNEYSSKSLNRGFTKARSMSELLPMDFHNPVAILYSHIDGVAKFAFMSEALDKANIRFKNTDLKRCIVNKFGENAYRTLEQSLMNVTYKKEAVVFSGYSKIIDNMIGNWIQANVALKPIVGLKQLLSANNYAVDMPYMTWQIGFLKALSNPKKTIDYMMKIPYLKARYGGNFSNEFLKSQIENSAFATSKKLKDACTLFIKLGDIGAIIFGGKPYIDYLIKEKGMSEEDAIKQFLLSTNRSQQSSAISSLSNFQVNMTRYPLGKLFIAFKNSPQQYIRMCGDAIVSVANGEMSKTQCAKMLFQFSYLQPFLYAVATSGSLLRFAFTGDDDDLIADFKKSIFNMGSDALPLLGDIYQYTLNKIFHKEKYLPQTTPLLGDIEQEINRISKEDVSLKDWIESIGYMTLHIGLGYNSKAITNSILGVADMATGEVSQGVMKVAGYTDKRSKHITHKYK